MKASYFHHLADYNDWANRKLYNTCASLDEEAYLKKRPSYFGSIHNTLNHILVADRVWMDRFTGGKTAPKQLDAVIYDNFATLLEARLAEDEQIMEYILNLKDEDVNQMFTYRDMKRKKHKVPLSICLGHFFNHQTHHRGQIHGLLSQEIKEPPALDLIYFTLEKLEGTKG